MGISAVALPGGEIVPAAQKGVIDAAEWINPGEDIKLGLQQIWKNYYLQGVHQASDLGEIIINKDFWNTLSPELQAIVEGAAQATVMQSLAAHIYRNAVALDELKSKYGVTVRDTPADLYPEFLRAAEKVSEEAAENNAFFAKVLASQRKFADTVVPYWTKQLDLYHSLGNATLGKVTFTGLADLPVRGKPTSGRTSHRCLAIAAPIARQARFPTGVKTRAWLIRRLLRVQRRDPGFVCGSSVSIASVSGAESCSLG